MTARRAGTRWSLACGSNTSQLLGRDSTLVLHGGGNTINTGQIGSHREKLGVNARKSFLGLPQDFMQAFGSAAGNGDMQRYRGSSGNCSRASRAASPPDSRGVLAPDIAVHRRPLTPRTRDSHAWTLGNIASPGSLRRIRPPE